MTTTDSTENTENTDTTTMLTCESCGMPIESGPYCDHCTDESGALQNFDERFRRMSLWQARSHPDQSREQVEKETLDYLATMPAWHDHPRVVAR
ncbi:hypothetical protein [Subtercola endophyticus]|uniref:hypothetical protein n=1 Tax=Subtercola endophyticus TaxID=2895559 RepID=UPI001E3452E3|nr:hypothetical protein [Subtercola endophyticus]UFS57449.1 hypothetical protein LQ955_10275 [Subtercola endophyticus]